MTEVLIEMHQRAHALAFIFAAHPELRRLGITDLSHVFDGWVRTGDLRRLRSINSRKTWSVEVYLFCDNDEIIDLSPLHPNERIWTKEELLSYAPRKIITAVNLAAPPYVPRHLFILH